MKNYLYPIIIALIIFGFSSMPGSAVEAVGFDWSYLAHFGIFGLLSFTTYRAYYFSLKKRSAFKSVFIIFIFLVLYAASDEWHQSFVPERDVSVLDFLTDVVGIVVGGLIYVWSNSRFRSRNFIDK